MTNRDRDSVARLLLQLAERLENGPVNAQERTKAWAQSDPGKPEYAYAYEAGMIGQVCRQEASTLRALVASYLLPRPPGPSGKR